MSDELPRHCFFCNGTGLKWNESWKGLDECRMCDGTGEPNEYE